MRIKKVSFDLITNFIHDESGQATTEYILILSIAVTTAVAFARGILEVLDRGMLRLGGALEKDLKSGREPLSVWRN